MAMFAFTSRTAQRRAAFALVLLLAACRGDRGSASLVSPSFSNIPVPGSHGCLCAIAADRQGNIWVANDDRGAVFKLSPAGKLQTVYNASSVGISAVGNHGTIRRPLGLSIDSAGGLWILEESSFVIKISADGKMIGSFYPGGTGPASMELDRDDNLWIANQNDDQGGPGAVGMLNSNGQLIRFIYNTNTPKAQFKSPAGLAIDENGNVWVANTDGDSITELNSEGAAIARFDNTKLPSVRFNHPHAIDVDRAGDLIVLNQDSVMRLSPTGELLGHFPTTGSSMAIDQLDRLWLTSESGVSVFRVGGQLISHFDNDHAPGASFADPLSVAIANGSVWTGNIHNWETATISRIDMSDVGNQFFPYGGLESRSGPQWPKSR